MPNEDIDSLRHEIERSHRRELDLLRSRLDDLAQRVELELVGLDVKIERRLEASEMRVAHQAVDMAVKKAFGHLGVDIDDPKDLQVFRDDLRFGGVFRSAATKSFYAMLLAIFGGIGLSLWMAFKDQFGWK
jgi:uncharacterized coiled-coil protein SlyX